MASKWRTLRLGSVCRKIGSGATPRGGGSVYLDKGKTSFIRSQNVYNDGFRRDGLAYLTDEHAVALDNVVVEQEDVLLNITGDSVARACQVAPDVLPARVNQHVAIIRPDPEILWPRFLRYALVTPSMQATLLTLAGVGATRNALTKGMIESLEILAPADIEDQKAIAHILGTLDDKIELNRRTNETLEAIARAIFQSWFIDFDPVRAKASGEEDESICRRLGLSGDLLALFPDRLVESEMGEIPVGWLPGTIEHLCDLNARTWTTKTLPAVVHYIDLANAKNGVISHVQLFNSTNAPSRARRVLRPGDTLVGTVRPGNRSFALIGARSIQLTASTGFAVLSPKRVELREIVYLIATSKSNIARLSHLADGAAYPAVLPGVVGSAECVIPPSDVIDAFHCRVKAPFDLLLANQAIDIELADARDALLPRLLSGEIRVPLEGAP